MGNGERTSGSPVGFIFRRVAPWFVLAGVLYYTYGLGRTYMNQKPQEETNPLVTTQTAPPKGKPIAKAKVVSETLNFRTKPSTSSGSVAQRLEKGTVLDVLGKPSKEWLRVQTPQGQMGYVSSSNIYVKVTPLKKK